MSEVETKTNPTLFTQAELDEMFNDTFLPMLQEFARRAHAQLEDPTDLAFFQVNMVLQFSDLENKLTYEMLGDKIQMKMQPVSKKALETVTETPESTE